MYDVMDNYNNHNYKYMIYKKIIQVFEQLKTIVMV